MGTVLRSQPRPSPYRLDVDAPHISVNSCLAVAYFEEPRRCPIRSTAILAYPALVIITITDHADAMSAEHISRSGPFTVNGIGIIVRPEEIHKVLIDGECPNQRTLARNPCFHLVDDAQDRPARNFCYPALPILADGARQCGVKLRGRGCVGETSLVSNSSRLKLSERPTGPPTAVWFLSRRICQQSCRKCGHSYHLGSKTNALRKNRDLELDHCGEVAGFPPPWRILRMRNKTRRTFDPLWVLYSFAR